MRFLGSSDDLFEKAGLALCAFQLLGGSRCVCHGDCGRGRLLGIIHSSCSLGLDNGCHLLCRSDELLLQDLNSVPSCTQGCCHRRLQPSWNHRRFSGDLHDLALTETSFFSCLDNHPNTIEGCGAGFHQGCRSCVDNPGLLLLADSDSFQFVGHFLHDQLDIGIIKVYWLRWHGGSGCQDPSGCQHVRHCFLIFRSFCRCCICHGSFVFCRQFRTCQGLAHCAQRRCRGYLRQRL
mmetsp:Transcript_35200/g.81114  ORF Transcript_35200/g.81114 Transcript_35200/m.81114 type:complete len:235 (-) Transcript_35200:1449-2153(-)